MYVSFLKKILVKLILEYISFDTFYIIPALLLKYLYLYFSYFFFFFNIPVHILGYFFAIINIYILNFCDKRFFITKKINHHV